MFHLLEWSGIDFELDIELNERWANPSYIDAWGQLVMKHTDDRRTVESEDEAFFLRIAKAGTTSTRVQVWAY